MTAVNLLEQMGITIKDTLTLTVNGVSFTFKRNDQAWAEMQTMGAKGQPFVGLVQYLIDTVEDADRENLMQVVNIPGFAESLFPSIEETFRPKFEVSVKN